MTETDPPRIDYARVRRMFDELEIPQVGGQLAYSTVRLANTGMRLGKSQDGNACLLLSGQSWGNQRAQDRHYANLRLRHGLRLRLEEETGVAERFSVLECVSRDQAVSDWFLRLLPTIVERVGTDHAPIDFDDQIDRIGELFRLLDRQSDTSLPGLWAELVLIVGSSAPVHAVRAWRSSEGSLHDFTSQGQHIEVKATEGVERRHFFSAAQLQPPHDVLIASLLLEEADYGASVMELYEEVIELLPEDPDLQEKVHVAAIAGVGRRLAAAEDCRYDVPAALGNAAFFVAHDVPQLAPPFPPGVSDVRFVADLTHAAPAPEETLRGNRLWASLSRRPGRG